MPSKEVSIVGLRVDETKQVFIVYNIDGAISERKSNLRMASALLLGQLESTITPGYYDINVDDD